MTDQTKGDTESVFDTDSNKQAEYLMQSKLIDTGALGKIFGGPENAPTNIAGLILIIFVLMLLGVIIAIVNFSKGGNDTTALEGICYKIILPVITLVVGFLFGKKQ
jgi:hypothetical protein